MTLFFERGSNCLLNTDRVSKRVINDSHARRVYKAVFIIGYETNSNIC